MPGVPLLGGGRPGFTASAVSCSPILLGLTQRKGKGLLAGTKHSVPHTRPTSSPAQRIGPGIPISVQLPKPSISPVSKTMPLTVCPPVPGLPPLSPQSQQDAAFTDHKCDYYEAISVRFRAGRDNRRAWLSHQTPNGSPAALNSDRWESSSQEGKRAQSFPTKSRLHGPEDQERALRKGLGVSSPLGEGRQRS